MRTGELERRIWGGQWQSLSWLGRGTAGITLRTSSIQNFSI